MSRNNHFTFNKYPEYRNRNNDYKNLKNDVRQLDNGDNNSKVYVNNIIKSNGKFTPARVEIEIQKLRLRKKLRGSSITLQQLITPNDEKKLNSSNTSAELNAFKKKLLKDLERYEKYLIKKMGLVDITLHAKTGIENFRKKADINKRNNKIKISVNKYQTETNTHQNNIEKLKNLLTTLFPQHNSIIGSNIYYTNPKKIKELIKFLGSRLYIVYNTLVDLDMVNKLNSNIINNYKNFRNKYIINISNININEQELKTFISTFIILYLEFMKIVLKIKEYHGNVPSLNYVEFMRKKLSKKYNKADNLLYKIDPNTVINDVINNVNNINTTKRILKNSLSSLTAIKKTALSLFSLFTTHLGFNYMKRVSNTSKSITRKNINNANGYTTNSGVPKSIKFNRIKYNKTKKYIASLSTPAIAFERLILKEPEKNKQILKFLIWLDMRHDFPPSKITNNYTQFSQINNIFGETKINNIMNHEIIQLLKSKNVIKIPNGQIKISSNFEESLVDILKDISNKNESYSIIPSGTSIVNTLKNIYKNKNYYISVNSKNSSQENALLGSKRLYIVETTRDPGSGYIKSGPLLKYISKSTNTIKKDIINFQHKKINFGNNLSFGYIVKNNTPILQFTKNKSSTINIIAGLSKNKAAKVGNYKAYLSKSFGDLMQIFNIASIHPKHNVFFFTVDRTAAFIYYCVRKYMYGCNDKNINLILQNKNYSIEFFGIKKNIIRPNNNRRNKKKIKIE